MGVFHGEASPSAIYAWEDAAQRHIFRIYAWANDGEHLLYDATTSAFVGVTGAGSSAAIAASPVAIATPPVVVVPRATTSAAAIPAVLSADSSVVSPLVSGTSTVIVPGPHGDSNIAPTVATAGADALPAVQDRILAPPAASAAASGRQPVLYYEGNGLISPPQPAASAQALPPVVAANFTVIAGAATAEVSGHVPSGDIQMTAPALNATAAASIPGVSMGVRPTITPATAGAVAPVVTATSSPIAPAASATAAAAVPAVITAINATVTSPQATTSAASAAVPVVTAWIPMRMNKSGNKTLTTSYVKVNTWTADAGYGGTVITTDGLVMAKTGTGKTITANAVVADTFDNTYRIDIRKNGTSIGIQSLTTGGGTVSLILTGQSVTAGDRLELYALATDNFNSPHITGGSSSFLKID